MKPFLIIAVSFAILIKVCDAESLPDIKNMSVIQSLYPDIYIDNCGFNVLSLALQYYNLPLTEAEKNLVGSRNEVSLFIEPIRAALEKRDLKTQVITDVKNLQLQSLSSKQSMAIAFSSGANSQHLFCIFSAKLKFLIVDYPAPMAKMSEQEVGKYLESHMVSSVLIVSQCDAPKKIVPKLGVSGNSALPRRNIFDVRVQSEVRAPAVLASQDVFEVPVVIENKSPNLITIDKAVGSCSCFVGLKEPVAIDISQTGTACLLFQTKSFNFLYGTKVALHINDVLGSQFIVSVLPPQSDSIPALRIMSRSINLGACVQKSAVFEVAVFTAEDFKEQGHIIGIRSDPSIKTNLVEITGHSFRLFDQDFWMEIATIKVDDIPTGSFVKSVSLLTSHPVDKTLDVTLSGMSYN